MTEKLKPVMTDEELAMFSNYLNGCESYFEFGSGGSTVFVNDFVPQIKKAVSVECDPSWVAKVSDFVDEGRVKLYFAPYSCGPLGVPKADANSVVEKPLWEAYSSAINKTKDLYDVVLVDGRFRVACALAAYQNLKDDGFLIVHDYESRQHYHEIDGDFYEKMDGVGELAVFKKRKVNIFKRKLSLANKYSSFKYDWR